MADFNTLANIQAHLASLTRSSAGRPVASAANHAAEAYIAGVLAMAGYEVERQPFDCIDWRLDSAELWLGDGPLPVLANPFSPACDVTATVIPVSNPGELEDASLDGRIALLQGELTATALFPKNYPFFSVEEHKRIIDLLEAKRPRAVITVSPRLRNPAPIIEDGDFQLPSATVTADVGAVMGDAPGPVTLRIRSSARPGMAANVIGRRAHPSRRTLILCAHFDTKPGTPGALDNAAGVATILALAERLANTDIDANVEVVGFNGEDHYAAPGEIAYLKSCGGEFGRIALLVNVDGVGLKGQPSTIAFFNCEEDWMAGVRAALPEWPQVEESPPWPEGDHSIFAMQGVPCVALTSGGIHALIDDVIHTSNDTLALVDPARIGLTVDFLHSILSQVGPPL